MRPLLASLVLVLAAVLPSAVQAQQHSTNSSSSSTSSLPTCATGCLVVAITASACSPINQTCICLDTELQERATACILASCTIKEALFTKNATQTTCGAPVRSRSAQLAIVTIVLGSLSVAIVAVRIASRFFVVKAVGEIGWDDWCIVATILLGIPNTVLIARLAIAGGLGLDVWTLTPDTITSFGQFFYVVEIIYFALVTLLKMSLLLFYLRIFPSAGVRRLLWATVGLNAVFGIAFMFLGAFQCRPVDFFWTKWDGEHEGKCLDINALGWANAAISVALDLWMLALPLSQLKGLNLHWKKKIGVGIMFCVGTFVTVMSILRLQSLVNFANSINPTWDNWDVTHWSVLEINVGIICTCLPALRLLLVRVFPRMGGSSNGYASGANKYYGSGARGGGGLDSKSRTRGGADGTATGRDELELEPPRSGFGVDSTVQRGSMTSKSRHEADAKARGGIALKRSYQVSYEDCEQDEESLVRMSNSNGSGVAVSDAYRSRHKKPPSKNSSSGSTESIVPPGR